MSQRRVNVKVEVDRNLRRFLKDFPDELQEKMIRGAGPRTARQGLAIAKANAPIAKRKNAAYANAPHLKHVLTTKQKKFKDGGAIFMVGPRSKMAPHTVLVEEGTKPRWTGNKSVYSTVGRKQVRGKNGRIFQRNIRKKTGDLSTGAARRPRGKMPAFHMLRKAFEFMKDNFFKNIEQSIVQTIRKMSK